VQAGRAKIMVYCSIILSALFVVGSEEEARMMVYSYGLNSDFNYAGTLLPNELYLDLYYRGLGMN
jgi:hypothetical protein